MFAAGEAFAYSNGEENRVATADQVYMDGYAIARGPSGSFTGKTEGDWWKKQDGSWTHAPPGDGMPSWFMPSKKCYRLEAPPVGDETLRIAATNPEEAFLVTGYDKESGERKEFLLSDLDMAKEDISMEEGASRRFIKANDNSILYQAQLLRSCTTRIKVNTWERDYAINLQVVRNNHKKTWANSKVKGFMWLLTSHALLVGTRLRGAGEGTPSHMCTCTEDIEHMAFHCPNAQKICKAVSYTVVRWQHYPSSQPMRSGRNSRLRSKLG